MNQETPDISMSMGSAALRLRYCPLEPGELVSREECDRCPHRPEPPLTQCSVPKSRSRPRGRGFWDQEQTW